MSKKVKVLIGFLLVIALFLIGTIAGTIAALDLDDKDDETTAVNGSNGSKDYNMFESSGFTRTDRVGGLYHWPCPGVTRVTSPYGYRSLGFHHGIDYGCPVGTKIIAVDDAEVTYVGYNNIYGNVIFMTLANEKDKQIVYGHIKCNGFKVKKGDKVKYGQVIALSGGADSCKGRSTGAHLHFEVRINNRAVNPSCVVNNCDSRTKTAIMTVRQSPESNVTGKIVWQKEYLKKVDVRIKSGITASQLRKGLLAVRPKNNPLADCADEFVRAEKEYSINAVLLVSLAADESAWGTSNFARTRNNLFGYEAYTNSPNSAKSFSSKRASIDAVCTLLNNSYLNPSGPYFNGYSLEKIKIRYCADKNWDAKIASIAEKVYNNGMR